MNHFVTFIPLPFVAHREWKEFGIIPKIETLLVPDEKCMRTNWIMRTHTHTSHTMPCLFASRTQILNLDYRFSHAITLSTNTNTAHPSMSHTTYLNCLPWKIFGCYFYFMQLLLHVSVFLCAVFLISIESMAAPAHMTHAHTFTPFSTTRCRSIATQLSASSFQNIRFSRC